MSNVVVATFVTVDGVMEDPGGSEGFEHGGWQLPFFDQDMADGVRDGLFAAGALLLGRVTYEQFAAAWPSMTDEDGFAERMTALPKYVASTTLKEPLAWNTALLDGDVPAAVAKLKWRLRRSSWSTPRRPAQGLSPSPTRRREPPRRGEQPAVGVANPALHPPGFRSW